MAVGGASDSNTVFCSAVRNSGPAPFSKIADLESCSCTGSIAGNMDDPSAWLRGEGLPEVARKAASAPVAPPRKEPPTTADPARHAS